VIRHTIATLARKKEPPQGTHGPSPRSPLATTTDVYRQEIPESVKATVEAISKGLRLKSESEELF
jgi:hypothetical protein